MSFLIWHLCLAHMLLLFSFDPILTVLPTRSPRTRLSLPSPFLGLLRPLCLFLGMDNFEGCRGVLWSVACRVPCRVCLWPLLRCQPGWLTRSCPPLRFHLSPAAGWLSWGVGQLSLCMRCSFFQVWGPKGPSILNRLKAQVLVLSRKSRPWFYQFGWGLRHTQAPGPADSGREHLHPPACFGRQAQHHLSLVSSQVGEVFRWCIAQVTSAPHVEACLQTLWGPLRSIGDGTQLGRLNHDGENNVT